MKTYSPTPEDVNREWFIVDATDKILGRLATEITNRLRGKHKPEFAPHMDMGDFIVVINADKIKVTGQKLDKKMYYKHSNHPGGLKEKTLREMLEKKPENVITAAVKGMLPKNRLAAQQLKKLKVYAGSEHPHAAQAPTTLDF
ncbi:50S ribosomal protein L13 [Pseudodesulfovibrio piezophilus]|uniref:Large ribosomal subunit protein uL13 n=1 Tax=Pseudodesulfovibrio piezophilus (strain DSM 21447 / JCM 15486 / C1TLV30) TaxID=1322246 RepID=M1WS45_PSEP2|nr:50S ribosomal protein L13 [Pseudodesulfovibrio piezophilus]CCH49959.1 50S ribosomal protein L13 [Pseudodesulfovibrio piezophilus C1TLV30]